MKKILYISHSAVTPFHLKKIIALSKYYKILLITPQIGREEGILYKVFSKKINNNLEHRVLKYFFPLKVYISFSPFIIREIFSFKPDLIYLDEEPMAFVSFFIVLLKKLFFPTIPIIVYTFENIKFNWYFRFPRYLFYNFFNLFVLNNIDALICVSFLTKKIYRKFKKSLEVIPHYIDIPVFDLKDSVYMKSNSELNILFVGRLIQEKGILFLLDVVSELSIPYKLHIVGDGELKNEILKIIDYKKMDVRLYGHVSHDKIYDFMERSDCLVVPSFSISTWKEQFGRVIIEAMAKGCIVVGSDSGAIPYVIDKYGFVFKEGNKEELLEILYGIYNKILTVSKEDLRKYVEENFSLSSVVKRTYNFIEKILS